MQVKHEKSVVVKGKNKPKNTVARKSLGSSKSLEKADVVKTWFINSGVA